MRTAGARAKSNECNNAMHCAKDCAQVPMIACQGSAQCRPMVVGVRVQCMRHAHFSRARSCTASSGPLSTSALHPSIPAEPQVAVVLRHMAVHLCAAPHLRSEQRDGRSLLLFGAGTLPAHAAGKALDAAQRPCGTLSVPCCSESLVALAARAQLHVDGCMMRPCRAARPASCSPERSCPPVPPEKRGETQRRRRETDNSVVISAGAWLLTGAYCSPTAVAHAASHPASLLAAPRHAAAGFRQGIAQ